MCDIKVRLAVPKDAGQILDIYAYYVENTAISFEEAVPNVQQFSDRIAETTAKYPYIVVEIDGVVRAYTYASAYRTRAAYRFDVETSIYMAQELVGRGIGKIMYTALFALLYEMNYYNIYAGITQPNEPSVRMHESMGFIPAGTWHGTGYKFGKWHDVKLMQKVLRQRVDKPKEPIAISDVPPEIICKVFMQCLNSLETVNKPQ